MDNRRPLSLRTFSSSQNFVQYSLQIKLLLPHIFNLLRTRRFSLDGDGAGVAEFVQCSEYGFEIDQSLADHDFFAKLAGISWPLAIFRMHAANVRAKDDGGVNRVRLAVENQ